MKITNIKEYSFCKVKDEVTGNRALIFIPYPFLFPSFRNNIIGKCILTTGAGLKNREIKYIEGEKYKSIKDKISNGRLKITKDLEMSRISKRYLPNCLYKRKINNIFVADLSIINKKCIEKIYDPIEIKNKKTKESEILKRIIDNLAHNFRILSEQIGLTGSLLFCDISNTSDIDLVFYVRPEKAKEIFNKIRKIQRETLESPKYRIHWPLQFLDTSKKIICVFFAYENPMQSPVYSYKVISLHRKIDFDSFVVDDRHSLYAPTILGIGKPKIKLLILGTACRGFYNTGDKITGKGQLVRSKIRNRIENFILVKDAWKELENFPK